MSQIWVSVLCSLGCFSSDPSVHSRCCLATTQIWLSGCSIRVLISPDEKCIPPLQTRFLSARRKGANPALVFGFICFFLRCFGDLGEAQTITESLLFIYSHKAERQR